ncbi:MAG TPA: hypothetical protein VNL98_05000 [Gemmatimonadales bacterium]|nr:hypothetical protein [Gemmatimonadales bacterium]
MHGRGQAGLESDLVAAATNEAQLLCVPGKGAPMVRAAGAIELSLFRQVGSRRANCCRRPPASARGKAQGQTRYQRDLSESHVKRLAGAIEALDRFPDPVIVVPPDGWQVLDT